MQVTLEDAYGEACKALGEAVVTQRLMAAEAERLRAENEALRTALLEGAPPADDQAGPEHT